ncbi:MAG TPA: hypothetical protein H9675_01410 [Firmicutes bacterium]|nr:hypothetical protein [Bacillota bacterium]
MKHIKVLLMSLVFMIALLLSGCDVDVYQEYVDAWEKTSQLESIGGSIEYDIGMQMNGAEISFPIKADYKMHTEDGAISQMLMDMSYSFLDQDIEASSYIDKEAIYIDVAGTKTKTSISTEDLSEYESMVINHLELTEDLLKNAERTVQDDAVSVSVTFDGNALREQLMDMFSNSFSDAYSPGMAAVQDIDYISEISDVTMKYTINADGYITSYGLDFSMNLDMNGTQSSASVSINMTYDNPGQPVEIEVPNLDEYEDPSLKDGTIIVG